MHSPVDSMLCFSGEHNWKGARDEKHAAGGGGEGRRKKQPTCTDTHAIVVLKQTIVHLT